MTIATQLSREAAALNRPAVRQPPRRPGSLRRTSSLQSLWEAEMERSYTIAGRSRDLATDAEGRAVPVGAAQLDVSMGLDGRLISLHSPDRPGLEAFAGLRPGGELRQALARDMPGEGGDETLLHRLLDDLAGAVFMAMAAWYRWPGGIEGLAGRTGASSPVERTVTGVCLSYVPGSPAMTDDGLGIDENADHPLGPVPFSQVDAEGFHAIVPHDGPNQWRLRRTDVWLEGKDLVVDAWFQDSSIVAEDPARRVIFHEYGVIARLDAASLRLADIVVTPHVLPYVTCHAAPATARALLGYPVGELPQAVLALLRKTAGCTHLNDMLRSLRDVEALARLLAQGITGPCETASLRSIAD